MAQGAEESESEDPVSMRFDRKICLVRQIPGQFNPKTGNYDNDRPEHFDLYASVMDTRTQMLTLVYGRLVQGSLTITFQNHIQKSFDWIELGGRRYKVDWRRRLQIKEAMVVSEVQV